MELRRASEYRTARIKRSTGISATVLGLQATDGTIGYGYIPGMVLMGETAASGEALVHGVVAPLLLAGPVASASGFITRLESELGLAHQVKCAVEQALIDLQGKLLGLPAHVLLGGLKRRSVPVMRMIGLGTPAETARRVADLEQQGHRYAKLKVGLDMERDVETVKAVRAAVAKSFQLIVDCNGSYTPKQAVWFGRQAEPLGVYLIEQPVRADDVAGMALVRQSVSIEIMADEGVQTAGDALRWIQAGAADAVSIKLWKQGGITESSRVASVCAVTNTRPHIGTTASSRLFEAAQATFAACQQEVTDGAEIAEFQDLEGDPVTGIDVVEGAIHISDEPGFGVRVDTSELQVTGESRRA